MTSCSGQVKPVLVNEALAGKLSFTSQNTKLNKTQGTDQYQIVGCSMRDKAGNLWFGTTGEGIYRYDGKAFTNFTEKDGLCRNGIFFILEDASGNMWFGSKEAIGCYNGKTFTNIPIPGAIGNKFVPYNVFNNSSAVKNELWSMMQDKSGTF